MVDLELWYAPTSPFTRKVRIAASELGLDDRIILTRVDPWTDAKLRSLNPLAKVPTLVLDDGEILFESSVICDYLDTLGVTRRIMPAGGHGRRTALLHQGLADGTMTAMGRLFADEHRPQAERSEQMMHRFAKARDAALSWLETAELRDEPEIGEISVAALLGYLDFRWPGRDWRSSCPNLAKWFDRFDRRPSMRSTAHKA